VPSSDHYKLTSSVSILLHIATNLHLQSPFFFILPQTYIFSLHSSSYRHKLTSSVSILLHIATNLHLQSPFFFRLPQTCIFSLHSSSDCHKLASSASVDHSASPFPSKLLRTLFYCLSGCLNNTSQREPISFQRLQMVCRFYVSTWQSLVKPATGGSSGSLTAAVSIILTA
jgi:hypothetical protein